MSYFIPMYVRHADSGRAAATHCWYSSKPRSMVVDTGTGVNLDGTGLPWVAIINDAVTTRQQPAMTNRSAWVIRESMHKPSAPNGTHSRSSM